MDDNHDPDEKPAEEPAHGSGRAEEDDREQDVKDRHLGDAAQHVTFDLRGSVLEGVEGIHPGNLHSKKMSGQLQYTAKKGRRELRRRMADMAIYVEKCNFGYCSKK